MKTNTSFIGEWSAEDDEWRSNCLHLANNLKDFKRDGIYCRKIANDLRDENTAINFYVYIKENYPHLIKKLDTFKSNDTIGNPLLYNVEDVIISPGTLRFVKILGDIEDFSPKSIIEIGSGYGGQCKIITDYINVDYTLVDIPESLELAKAYLDFFDVRATFVSSENVVTNPSYDLVISDYAVTELDSVGMNFYIDNIIRKCKNASFTVNYNSPVKQEFISLLKKLYYTVNITAEEPITLGSNISIKCTELIK